MGDLARVVICAGNYSHAAVMNTWIYGTIFLQGPASLRRSGARSFGSCRPHCGADAEDRKSTRLNSSHRTISYAVFCLKKKTKKGRRLSAHRSCLGYVA